MSNDDLGLTDLSPNILDDWERWASDRTDRETPQTSTERKVIALVRGVRQLRAELSTTAAELEEYRMRLAGALTAVEGHPVDQDDKRMLEYLRNCPTIRACNETRRRLEESRRGALELARDLGHAREELADWKAAAVSLARLVSLMERREVIR